VPDLSGVNSKQRRSTFILNKWDQIVNKDETLEAVQEMLAERWSTESSISQDQPTVLPFSATLDMEHLEAGYISDRLEDVIKRIQEVAIENMDLNLCTRFKWLQFVVSRVEHHCQRYLTHSEAIQKQEVSKVEQEAEDNLKWATVTGKQCKEEFSSFCKTISLSDAVDELRGYLKEEGLRATVNNWKDYECSRSDMNMSIEEAKQKISERIRDVLQSWGGKSQDVSRLKMEVQQCMKRCLAKLQVDITSASKALTATQSLQPTIPNLMKKKYNENRVLCMTEATNAALNFLGGKQQLTKLLRDLIGLPEIEKKFSKFVDTYVGQFTAEVRDLRKKEKATTLSAIYSLIEKDCRKFRKDLLKWELENIFEGIQVQSKDVTQTEKGDLIGFNYFADFTKAEIARGAGEPLPVIIKKYKGPVDGDIRFIMREYNTMR
jgi:hypothetical protein